MSSLDFTAMVNSSREALTNNLATLVQAAAGGHDSLQEFVADRLREAGAAVEVVHYRPSDVRVSYEIGAATPLEGTTSYVLGSYGEGGDGLLFWAHSDSEPVDPNGWTKPLFDGLIENGRMHGWGIGDDLVGVALMLALADLEAEHDFLGQKRTLLASAPSKQRAQAIIDLLDRGNTGSGSVYLHPAESGVGLAEIKAVASGLLRFRIRILGRLPETGEPGHTVFWHTAVDPVLIAAQLIEALKAFGDRRAAVVHYPPVHDAIGRSTNVHVSHIEAGNRAKLGKIPAHVNLFASLTFPPTERMGDVQQQIVAELERFSSSQGWLREHPLEVEWLVGIGGAAIPLDSRIYQLTETAITEATGKAPHVNPLHAGSDIRNPWLHKGIPTVGIGPKVGDLTVSAGVDEWVDVEDYLRAVEVVCRIAHAYSTAH